MACGKRDAEPGDLIEIQRSGFQHWALYLGDGYVVHLTSAEGIPPLSADCMAILTRRAKVKMQLLKDVVGNNGYRVNNKYDHSCPPFSVKDIIRRAEIYIDTEVTYDLLESNCEHFVTWLRYGERVSIQAKRAIRRGRSFTRKVFTVALVGGAAVAAAPAGSVAVVAAAASAALADRILKAFIW
ncbi:PREDICTED: phospholipid-metabolizing enzyme A-C1-like isoform X2 [Lepidothrix coronata]|uniref:Phospholipid-metabolizing enzyme A-C1-like isoform X2 n=1 Tax=Lepidothrix coronata TaxID=321398 RepID=A0A6J0GX06_9PASS|nr:PREDICTED: phospholipid-metabolizing enzyme A-C1-like isoform X2 [Lepidothrix coronata]